MAKLILSFKSHHLSIHHLEEAAPTTIGRDEDCGIHIDSLAVAPMHAELVPSEGEYLVLALDPDYPVLVNAERVDQATLNHGDQIQIGKHTLSYSEDAMELAPPRPAAEPDNEEPENVGQEMAPESVPAYIQFQSGRQIGKVVIFNRALTRLKRAGSEGVVVSRNGDTYRLLLLDRQADVRIDGRPVEDEEVELHNNNVVQVNQVRFQFFSGEAGKPPQSADED